MESHPTIAVLLARFEKSVGPAWPARQATPRSGRSGEAGKENTEAFSKDVAGQQVAIDGTSTSAEKYLVFTPHGQQS